MRYFLVCAAVFVFLFPGSGITAQEKGQEEDISDVSLEALLNFEVSVASKKEESVQDAPGIISVLTNDEINRFGGTTLMDILNRIPGIVSVSSSITDRSMVAPRGDAVRGAISNRHVLVLIDGRPVREVQEGGIKSEVYESFPVEAIDHIEVIKGPGSVLYGSEAYSAVINVVTKKVKKSGLSVMGMWGEGEAYGVSGKAEVQSKDFSLLLAARHVKKSDWPVTYNFSNFPNGPTVSSRSHVIPNRSFGTYLGASYKNFKLSGFYTRWEHSDVFVESLGLPSAGNVTHIGNVLWRKLFLDGGCLFNLSKEWTLTANVTYNRSWFDITNGSYPNVTRDSYEILGELTSFLTLSKKARLTIGGLISRISGLESIIDSGIVVSEGSKTSFSGYAQFDYRFLENLKAIAGFQALKYADIPATLVPRAGIIWNPTRRLTLKLLYGEAFRAPYLNENNLDHPGLLGNKYLKPELVHAVEVGVSYTGTRANFGFSYFHNHQSDIITYAFTQDSPDRAQYINSGKAVIQGVEFEGKYYVNKSLFLSGSCLYQDSEELTGISNFGAKFGISFKGKYGLISLFNVFQGSMSPELFNPNSDNPEPGSYSLLYLHARLDLNRLFKLNSKQEFTVILQGDNLLNQEIWVPALGVSWPDVLPFKKGRTVYVGLEASL